MDAVGDGGDGDFGVVEAWPEPGEHLAGDHAVEFGHAVGTLRQAQAHHGHVEDRGVAAVVVFPAQVQDLLHGHVRGQSGVEEVPDLHGLETVDAGRHRVWVVNTVDARPAARASDQLSGASVDMSSWMRSMPRNPAWPSLVWNTSGAGVPVRRW
ncbi:hypothetical protein AHiyo8_60740 [Arthrobacter sp. Hiyo8]|nr:hypothetical protein AHiyo8_60740 [Arthrobacter sp. Hiyo8]